MLKGSATGHISHQMPRSMPKAPFFQMVVSTTFYNAYEILVISYTFSLFQKMVRTAQKDGKVEYFESRSFQSRDRRL